MSPDDSFADSNTTIGSKNVKKADNTTKNRVKKSSDTSHEIEQPKRNLRSNSDYVKISDDFDTIYDFESKYNSNPEAYENLLKYALKDFEIPRENRRNGNCKKFYNYLLLDSRKCKSTSWTKAGDWDYLKNPETGWKDFLDLIFYVGKGEGNRVWEHAEKLAKKKLEANLVQYLQDGTEKTMGKCSEEEWIIDIWKNGGSVLIVIFVDYIISEEALTREAAMIDAIGKKNLTNKKREKYYGGIADIMSPLEKRQLGATILMSAKNYLTERGKITDHQDPPNIMKSINNNEGTSKELGSLSEDLMTLNLKN